MINEKYSYKSFPYHGLSFKDIPASEFNDTEIIGGVFYQEWCNDGDTMKDIFPDGIHGVTFRDCVLDNVYIPVGNTIIGGTHKRIRVQNDMEDWIVDEDDKPVEPLHKRRFEDVGFSIDPKDIPAIFNRIEILAQDEYNTIKETTAFKQWWIGTPTVTNQEERQIIHDGIETTKTFITIEGPGVFMLQGIPPRASIRRSCILEKARELREEV